MIAWAYWDTIAQLTKFVFFSLFPYIHHEAKIQDNTSFLSKKSQLSIVKQSVWVVKFSVTESLVGG